MKVTLHKEEQLNEIEVTIAYEKMSERLRHMVRTIQQFDHKLVGKADNQKHLINLEELLYVDSIDGKTFLYTSDSVYESDSSISMLETELAKTTVIRIGKSTLLNMTHLSSVGPYPNHRLLAKLSNQECLVVSRKYIHTLQDMVRRL